MNQEKESITSGALQKEWNRKRMIQSGFIALLIFLSLTRWIPGGNVAAIESSARAYIEIILLVAAFVISILFWGLPPLIQAFRSPIFLVAVLYGVWAFISGFWAPSQLLALGKAVSYLLLVLTAGGMAVRLRHDGIEPERLFFPTTVIGILFLLAVNWVQLGSPFVMQMFGTRERFSLAFDHPNDASFPLFLVVFFATIFFEKQRKITHKILVFLIGLGGAVGLYFTNSRTAIALTVLYLLTYPFLRIIKSKRQIFFGVIIACLALSLLLFVASAGVFNEVFQVSPDQTDELSTLNGRVPLWDNLLTLSETSPWIGMGYFASRTYGLEDSDWAFSAHNTLLDSFFSLGFVGLFQVGMFIVFSFTLFINPQNHFLALVLFLYILFEGLLETTLFVPNFRMFILLLFLVNNQIIQFSKTPPLNQSLIKR
jgi:O-antigen ligase